MIIIIYDERNYHDHAVDAYLSAYVRAYQRTSSQVGAEKSVCRAGRENVREMVTLKFLGQ